MLNSFIASRIRAQLPFTPNTGQEDLLAMLGVFLVSPTPEKAFLLKGYAGTGKTSMVAALVRAMEALQQKTVLLAPTGRAAKVIAAYSGFPAYTIHKKIYRQRAAGDFRFGLADNLHKHTLFIIDEASMVSNSASENSTFGTGRLLDDLIEYVYSGDQCALLLLGDTAQLPPVGQPESPALEKERLEGYGLQVTECVLTQVARQALESGILFNATAIRQQIADGQVHQMPTFTLDGFTDVRKLQGEDMMDELQRAYNEVGLEGTMVVTRTNRRANLYNQGIRARVMWKEDELTNGDRLMITKNNYFWTKAYEGIDFLANGDIMEVTRIRKHRELYGCRFVDVSLKSVDYDWEIDATLLLDSLNAETPDSNRELSNTLFNAIAEDYPEIHSQKQLTKTIMENPYFNALQVKFAYAVTCHKAQGGQWQRVFIDQGMIGEEQLGSDYYRWLYTAITRATEKAFLINF